MINRCRGREAFGERQHSQPVSVPAGDSVTVTVAITSIKSAE